MSSKGAASPMKTSTPKMTTSSSRAHRRGDERVRAAGAVRLAALLVAPPRTEPWSQFRSCRNSRPKDWSLKGLIFVRF